MGGGPQEEEKMIEMVPWGREYENLTWQSFSGGDWEIHRRQCDSWEERDNVEMVLSKNSGGSEYIGYIGRE